MVYHCCNDGAAAAGGYGGNNHHNQAGRNHGRGDDVGGINVYSKVVAEMVLMMVTV